MITYVHDDLIDPRQPHVVVQTRIHTQRSLQGDTISQGCPLS